MQIDFCTQVKNWNGISGQNWASYNNEWENTSSVITNPHFQCSILVLQLWIWSQKMQNVFIFQNNFFKIIVTQILYFVWVFHDQSTQLQYQQIDPKIYFQKIPHYIYEIHGIIPCFMMDLKDLLDFLNLMHRFVKNETHTTF